MPPYPASVHAIMALSLGNSGQIYWTQEQPTYQTPTSMASKKRSPSDMRRSIALVGLLDEENYHTNVLCLPNATTEDDIDYRLNTEAHDLGIMLPTSTNNMTDRLASSLSATTIGSDPKVPSSVLSQSTGLTSCSSSYHRPPTQSSASYISEKSATQSITPSLMSDNEKRKSTSFRDGIRRMTGFKKRRSVLISPSALASIDGNAASTFSGDRMSLQNGMKSAESIKSASSFWSSPPSASNLEHQQDRISQKDNDSVNRSQESKELLAVRSRQLEMRSRFIDFQSNAREQLRLRHHSTREKLLTAQKSELDKATKRNEKAVEDLELRHLEAEMKLLEEFEVAKRSILIRLRHMEAYVQTPTPPPTPQASTSSRDSDEQSLPERKVTDKDYHNLAQQYRERDAMESLHKSKIEVLRGKQNKSLENFMNKKDREIVSLKVAQGNAVKEADETATQEKEALRQALDENRKKLEARWRLEAQIERAKLETITGLHYAALPDITISDEGMR